jgi:hypothetical protein
MLLKRLAVDRTAGNANIPLRLSLSNLDMQEMAGGIRIEVVQKDQRRKALARGTLETRGPGYEMGMCAGITSGAANS